jgi:hypothetical protein
MPAHRWSGLAIACALVFVVAAALRLGGLFDDFWLDEIWSWMFSKSARSVRAIFVEQRHDNNHWLNTLFLYCLGQQHWYVYRLLALLTGTGSVVVAGLIGRWYGRLEGLLCLFLVGFSYILIHYSSEARGYGPAVFFALLSFYLLRLQVPTQKWWRGALFAVAATLGFLSHLTFLYVYAGLVVWSAAAFLRWRRTWIRALGNLLLHHALPCAVILLLYFVNIRHMVIGGGDPRPLMDVLRETVVWSLGAPDLAAFVTVFAALAACAAAGELLWTRGKNHWEWLFYLTAILVAPALLLWFAEREDVYPRYFLLSVPFLLILLGRILARCLRRGPAMRVAAAVVLLGFTLGNLVLVADFLRVGRGHYRAAIRYMMEHNPGHVVSVGSDHDWRNFAVLQYYVRNYFPEKYFDYVPEERWSRSAPYWVLLHQRYWEPVPDRRIIGYNGLPYTLQQVFPYAGASGWSWYLYRVDVRR